MSQNWYLRDKEPLTDIEISPITAILLIIALAVVIGLIKSYFSKGHNEDDDFDPDIF